VRCRRRHIDGNSVRCCMAKECLGNKQRPLHMLLDGRYERVLVCIFDGFRRSHYGGIADQDVNLPVTDEVGESCVDLTFLRDICRSRKYFDTRKLALDRSFDV
jgi:hypothetical protein